MSSPKKHLALAVIPKGASFSWRFGGADAESDLSFAQYKHMAQTVERGKFDVIFLADSLSVREDRIGMEKLKGSGTALYFDAVTVLGALAAVTKHVGLVATASTTYNQPYHLARKFASIDHISKGRAGWNVITSGQDTEAFNFGLDKQLSNEIRYERASEFLEIVLDLWDSWEDGAIVRDFSTNTYFHPEAVHRLNHVGKHFKVRGPLNLSRPPQGHPVICQAGGSVAGWEMAARTADILFGKAITLQEAQRFYSDVKGRMAKYDRTPDQLKIMLGLLPVVGRTEKEAQEKFRAVQDCLSETEGRATLAHYVPGIDFSNFALDEPIPDTLEINLAAKRFRIFLEADGRRLSLKDMLNSVSSGVGTLKMIGTPGQVAENMMKWLEEKGADGFTLSPHFMPGGLEDFVDMVVPELQSRGVFRSEYEGTTLRENLGLARPKNRFLAGKS
jgi:FMN-dependent oxidoreductase (nitrilotriacetate monooxygenase family)